MNLSLFFSDLSHTPSKYFVPKLFSTVRLKLLKLSDRRRDRNSLTYFNTQSTKVDHLIDFDKMAEAAKDDTDMSSCVNLYRKHYFNILGSGWRNWELSENESIIGKKEGKNLLNTDYSEQVKSIILKENSSYQFIDWQCVKRLNGHDYKYSLDNHFSEIKVVAPEEGIDVKVVWELGRLQHLPVMMTELLRNREDHLLKNEIIHQVLDFIASNPPRFGVQWTSAMEVSIRLFNLSVVVDLLAQFDDDFRMSKKMSLILSYLDDLLDFAWKYREEKGGLTNNHYLANLLGVMYASKFLLRKELYEKSSELILKEIDKQFLIDGGNFESSVPYHFFSSEMAAIALSIMPVSIKVSTELSDKIRRALSLMEMTVTPDNTICQIGDNDSARMLRFSFQYDNLNESELRNKYLDFEDYTLPDFINGEYPDANELNYSTSIEMVNALFSLPESTGIHGTFISSIKERNYDDQIYAPAEFSYKTGVSESELKYRKETIYESPEDTKGSLLQSLRLHTYTEFGLLIFKGSNIQLVINATKRNVEQYWPHGHFDKLSYDLWINGHPIFRDPGSYSYTGNIKKRNLFRSAEAHNIIIPDSLLKSYWDEDLKGVFRNKLKCEISVIEINNHSVKLRAKYSDYIHERQFIIEEEKVIVKDACDKPFHLSKTGQSIFSAGYGKLSKLLN